MLKVVNDFIKKVFGKDEFVLLIKSVMVQNINKKKRIIKEEVFHKKSSFQIEIYLKRRTT